MISVLIRAHLYCLEPLTKVVVAVTYYCLMNLSLDLSRCILFCFMMPDLCLTGVSALQTELKLTQATSRLVPFSVPDAVMWIAGRSSNL